VKRAAIGSHSAFQKLTFTTASGGDTLKQAAKFFAPRCISIIPVKKPDLSERRIDIDFQRTIKFFALKFAEKFPLDFCNIALTAQR